MFCFLRLDHYMYCVCTTQLSVVYCIHCSTKIVFDLYSIICTVLLCESVEVIVLTAWIAQWERRTRDRKVAGSNPCWSGGRIFFSGVNFLCWLLFRHTFHPRVTAVARKRPRSFCQKRSRQVTAKHAYTLRMWLCMKWDGAWLYGVHLTHRHGSSFLWHQPCQRCKYNTSVDIQKSAMKS